MKKEFKKAAIYLGRNKKCIGAIIRKDGKNGMKIVETENVLATIMNGVAKYIEKEVEAGADRIDLITIESVAIACKRIYCHLKRNRHSVEKTLRLMTANSFYAISDRTPTELVEPKKETFKALNNLIMAHEKAIDKKVYIVHNSDYSFNKLYLKKWKKEVPAPKEGDIVDFVKGTSKEGYSLNGWNNFNKKGAKIRMDKKGRPFIVHSKSPFYLAIRFAIAELWKQCPVVANLERAEKNDLF